MSKHFISDFIRWVGSHELAVWIGLSIIVAGSWGFIELADEVHEGDTQAIDESILKSMRRPDDLSRPIGPAWLIEAGRDVTALGGYAFLIYLSASVAMFLRIERKHAAMWFVLGAVIGGYIIMRVLKELFGRPRPDVVPHLSEVVHASFPSGHSMMSAIVFLTLGALLSRLTTNRLLKFYFLVQALLLTILVGVSRVYLGVHYPSDVLAGWTCGLVWSAICSLVALQLQKRGEMSTEL